MLHFRIQCKDDKFKLQRFVKKRDKDWEDLGCIHNSLIEAEAALDYAIKNNKYEEDWTTVKTYEVGRVIDNNNKTVAIKNVYYTHHQ